MEIVKQVAVIPWRKSPKLQVLIIRKCPNGGWGIPKGRIDDHNNDYLEAARMECLEEAGAEGQFGRDFVGEFKYRRADVDHHVRVLLMKVSKLRDRYREMEYRERMWSSIDDAVEILERKPVRWLVSELPRWVD